MILTALAGRNKVADEICPYYLIPKAQTIFKLDCNVSTFAYITFHDYTPRWIASWTVSRTDLRHCFKNFIPALLVWRWAKMNCINCLEKHVYAHKRNECEQNASRSPFKSFVIAQNIKCIHFFKFFPCFDLIFFITWYNSTVINNPLAADILWSSF